MRISLAEEIREISEVAPKDLDPDDLHFEPDDRERDASAATEHYLLELGCVHLIPLFRSIFYPRSQSLRYPQGPGQLIGSKILRKACIKDTAAR